MEHSTTWYYKKMQTQQQYLKEFSKNGMGKSHMQYLQLGEKNRLCDSEDLEIDFFVICLRRICK